MTPFAALLLILSITFYTCQNFFNKLYSISYNGPSSAVTPVFAILYGLIAGISTFVYNGCAFSASTETLLLGVCNGIILFLFNLAAISAARTGPYAFQSIMMLFGNILLPLLFSAFWWKDSLSMTQLLGIGTMLLAFLLFNLKGLRFDGTKKGYFFWIILLFLSNGAYGIFVDAQQRVALGQERNEMIIATFITSAIISIVHLLCTQKKDSLKVFRMERKTWLFAIGSSVSATIAINILMLTLSVVPAAILYTLNNGGILIMCALLSAVVLKERIEKHMVAGIAVAILSLILLSL